MRKGIKIAACAAALALAVGLLYAGYNIFMKKMYPLDYDAPITAAAAAHGVDATLIRAVIRTESGFDPQAVSSAGACGLMQLMPETLAWAKQRDPAFEKGDIFDVRTNVYYGTLVLQYQYQTFGHWETALAAYNAGGTTVQGWLADARYSRDGRTLHTIPYPETADFIERVLHAQQMYQKLYQGG